MHLSDHVEAVPARLSARCRGYRVQAQGLAVSFGRTLDWIKVKTRLRLPSSARPKRTGDGGDEPPRRLPLDMVRLACRKCPRRGQYRKATLLERYGPNQNTVELRSILVADCPKVIANRATDLCGVVYPDTV